VHLARLLILDKLDAAAEFRRRLIVGANDRLIANDLYFRINARSGTPGWPAAMFGPATTSDIGAA
jgi:hypothetical protein